MLNSKSEAPANIENVGEVSPNFKKFGGLNPKWFDFAHHPRTILSRVEGQILNPKFVKFQTILFGTLGFILFEFV